MRISPQDIQMRYGQSPGDFELEQSTGLLSGMISRGSCRTFTDREVPSKLTELLCAAALASPTKSDLQQRDIVLVTDVTVREQLIGLVGTEPWVSDAPNIAVFCGNNRRQRMLHQIRDHTFVNDHLDAFFNATVDAGIALSAFITAAEALGLGCCPISAVRNEAADVSELLGLPDYVFPVAGLAFGYPSQNTPTISLRLPLSATVHENKYAEMDIVSVIAAYDQRRQTQQPYAAQRATGIFGKSESYSWSEDKSRQYALPERQSFGEFIRSKGFDLS